VTAKSDLSDEASSNLSNPLARDREVGSSASAERKIRKSEISYELSQHSILRVTGWWLGTNSE